MRVIEAGGNYAYNDPLRRIPSMGPTVAKPASRRAVDRAVFIK